MVWLSSWWYGVFHCFRQLCETHQQRCKDEQKKTQVRYSWQSGSAKVNGYSESDGYSESLWSNALQNSIFTGLAMTTSIQTQNCNQLDFNYKLSGSQQSTRAEECNMTEEFAVNKPVNHCCRCLNTNRHNEILALENVQKFALRICSGAVTTSHFLICSVCQAYPIGEKPWSCVCC